MHHALAVNLNQRLQRVKTQLYQLRIAQKLRIHVDPIALKFGTRVERRKRNAVGVVGQFQRRDGRPHAASSQHRQE